MKGMVPRLTPKSYRPILESEILHAQKSTESGKEAARFLNVDYKTYMRYAKMYGLFDTHKQKKSKQTRPKMRGLLGLHEILAGKHPNYPKRKLKDRLIRAGYLAEECALCGFAKKRDIDFICPLLLHCVDGDNHNYSLDNLQLRCLNCSFLTTGIVQSNSEFNPGVYEGDLQDRGLSQADIEAIQKEIWESFSAAPYDDDDFDITDE